MTIDLTHLEEMTVKRILDIERLPSCELDMKELIVHLALCFNAIPHGSRFLGGHTEESDYDYFIEEGSIDHEQLIDLGLFPIVNHYETGNHIDNRRPMNSRVHWVYRSTHNPPVCVSVLNCGIPYMAYKHANKEMNTFGGDYSTREKRVDSYIQHYNRYVHNTQMVCFLDPIFHEQLKHRKQYEDHRKDQ